jgi:uncharacterized protein (TIGR03790 family)
MRRAYRLFFITVLFISSLVLITAKTSGAVLKPEEILVVVNKESIDSVRMGKLYIALRYIPSSNLAGISAPFQDEISRKQYDEQIAGPLRKTIHDLQDKGKRIRCIVTMYGVPLRISPVMPSDTSQEEIRKYEDILKQKKAELSELKEQPKWWNKIFKKTIRKSDIDQLQTEINKRQFELDHLTGKDTIAAVDSELALLLSSSYDLAGWQLNPEFTPFKGRMNSKNKVLMVSRIDAPTPALAEKMMRTAVEVEKTGLSGKLYLDARGFSGENDYAKFDEDIRRTAQILEKGLMPVVLDNKPELFGPGEAPMAALYCGWYSLGEYKDAFEWAKGAVGYHVASSEAVSLHDPGRNYWVKGMLERGVIASLGPVTEPYLTAFPPPSLFFPLLMSGQYSLAEVFAMTNPFLSWRMILVGDPLYNPFRAKPAYPLKDPPPPPR